MVLKFSLCFSIDLILIVMKKITIKKIGKIQLCALMHELNKIDSTNKIRKKNIIQLIEIINNKEDLKALEFNFKDNNFLRLPVICSKEKKEMD